MLRFKAEVEYFGEEGGFTACLVAAKINLVSQGKTANEAVSELVSSILVKLSYDLGLEIMPSNIVFPSHDFDMLEKPYDKWGFDIDFNIGISG